jgi:hypothetical protein
VILSRDDAKGLGSRAVALVLAAASEPLPVGGAARSSEGRARLSSVVRSLEAESVEHRGGACLCTAEDALRARAFLRSIVEAVYQVAKVIGAVNAAGLAVVGRS